LYISQFVVVGSDILWILDFIWSNIC